MERKKDDLRNDILDQLKVMNKAAANVRLNFFELVVVTINSHMNKNLPCVTFKLK